VSKTINPKREALTQAARVLKENQYKLRNGFSDEDADEVEAVYCDLINNLEKQLSDLAAIEINTKLKGKHAWRKQNARPRYMVILSLAHQPRI
jgi:hypothetical protein